MPFLLSPAGSMPALRAAVDAGADEVYLGGPVFNARMNAGNFDRETLVSAASLCRRNGVRLHITLNTLIRDREFASAMEYVGFLAREVRPDAIIIQDLGLAAQIRREYPSLALHASTQLRIHSYLDAEFLKDFGFTRAVLARELPEEDIKAFAAAVPETEIFVHGALCVSESGGCLMSSVIGGRSGNRGECAQPCRLPCGNGYALSLKDLCLADRMDSVLESGVTSLKIEGRMKSPDYVYAVTSVYRRLIDEHRNATENELRFLADVFSRGGFTSGYYDGRIDDSMFGFRSERDKKRTAAVTVTRAPAYPPRALPPCPLPGGFNLPERDSGSCFPAKLQQGIVARFEYGLPSAALLRDIADKCVRIDVPLYAAAAAAGAGCAERISAVLPRSIFVHELPEVKRQLAAALSAGVRHATVSGLYQAKLCAGFFLHGDYSLNVYNRKTLETLDNYSFSSLMLSPETEGTFARSSRCALEYIVYGRTPLMYTRVCILRSQGRCGGEPPCRGALSDRSGARFPVIGAPNHTNTIYNSLPGYRADRASELKKHGVGLLTLLFTNETERDIKHILSLASAGKKADFEYTRR